MPMGDGAACLTLESAVHARARGAQVLAVVADAVHGHGDTAQQLSAEPYLPVAYDFDGNADLADNADNYKRDDVSGAQEPTAYFHRAAQPVSVEGIGHVVYEYWLYFAGEMLGQQQAHDWECYFVYLKEAEV